MFEETGSGPEVDVEWPNPPQDLDPQTLDVTISFQRCFKDSVDTAYHPQFEWRPRSAEIRAQGGGDEIPIRCATIAASGQLTVGVTLTVLRGQDKIAVSQDNPQRLLPKGAVRLSKIHAYEPWTIRLSGIDNSKPDELEVKIKSSVSNREKIVIVKDLKDDGNYEGTFPADASEILVNKSSAYTYGFVLRKSDERRTNGGGFDPFLDLRSFANNKSVSDAATSLQTLALSLGTSYHPYSSGPRMGALEYLTTVENAPYESTNPYLVQMQNPAVITPNHALGSSENFTKYGFEDVVVSFEDLEATVKVQNQASLNILLAHGGDDSVLEFTNFLIDNNGQFRRFDQEFSPLNEDTGQSNMYGTPDSPPNLRHLKTLALTSCNVLDVYDYNNVRVGDINKPSRTSPDDPISVRSSPGINWWKATRYDPTSKQGPGPILLGYNYPLQDIHMKPVLANYRTELSRLRGSVNESVLQQYAWLSANATIKYRELNGSPRNACAWDSDYYYYIAFDDPTGNDYDFVRIPVNLLVPGLPGASGTTSPRASDKTIDGLPPGAQLIPGL